MQNRLLKLNPKKINQLADQNLALIFIFSNIIADINLYQFNDVKRVEAKNLLQELIADYNQTQELNKFIQFNDHNIKNGWHTHTRPFLKHAIAQSDSARDRVRYQALLDLMEQDLGLSPLSKTGFALQIGYNASRNFAYGFGSTLLAASAFNCVVTGLLLVANLSAAVVMPPVAVVLLAFAVLSISLTLLYGTVAGLIAGTLYSAVKTPQAMQRQQQARVTCKAQFENFKKHELAAPSRNNSPAFFPTPESLNFAPVSLVPTTNTGTNLPSAPSAKSVFFDRVPADADVNPIQYRFAYPAI